MKNHFYLFNKKSVYCVMRPDSCSDLFSEKESLRTSQIIKIDYSIFY